MNQMLNDDMLGEIIKWTFQDCTLVCKRWMNIIMKNSVMCSTCGKIVKMYGKQIWTTSDKDKFCHMHFYKSRFYSTLYKKIHSLFTSIMRM